MYMFLYGHIFQTITIKGNSVVIQWWYLLSTLIPFYFEEENWKTSSVIYLCRQMYNWKLPDVNSPLNVWGMALWHHTNFTDAMDRILWNIKASKSAEFLEIHLCENNRKKEDALSLEFHPFSPMFLCEQQGEEERWREVDTCAASTWYWLRDVTYHSLDTYQNWQCLIENWTSWNLWLKNFSSCPLYYRTLKSSSKNVESKNILMHKYTTFLASRLIHRFLMFARLGSTRYHKSTSIKNSADRTP